MKKLIYTLIFSILTILTIGGFSNTAFAITTTSAIEFESSPLFGTANFVPGESVTKWVKFTNSTDISLRAYLRVAEIINTNKFGDAVNLVVKKGDTILYNDTFSNFFDKEKIELSQVKAGETDIIYFIATFIPESGNNYQNKTMSFGLQAILEDVDESSDTTTVIGGSGGGTFGSKHLVISNENANFPQNNTTTSINVSWNTNIPATSQVIYGLLSEGPYTLDISAPNFGYPFSTIEADLEPSKVTNHIVTINGLPEGLYVYRVVSRASPATVGYEHTFAIAYGENNNLPKEKINGNDGVVLDELPIDENDSGIKNTIGKVLGASVGDATKVSNNFIWFALILLLIIIILIIIYRQKKKNEKSQ